MDGQQPDIGDLRHNLDEVDTGIVGLIAERMQIITEIGRRKQQHGTSAIQDADRERRVLDGVEDVATDLGVSASLVRRIFRELISESVAQQAGTLNGTDGGPGPGRLPGLAALLRRRRRAEVPGRPGGGGRAGRVPDARPRRRPRCWRARRISRCCPSRTPPPAASTRSTPCCASTSCSSSARRPGRSTTAWPPCAMCRWPR